ncbi:hypothetical protein FACS1894170_07380 [Planctomycetales bacterium]|nr:hypothetical protein FACS1894170_07380 [Planctomycetales bacterium]
MQEKLGLHARQFRFVIAAVLILAAGLKAYQLATVPLPPVVQNSVFTPFLELLNHRYLLIFVVEAEILFALFLISGFAQPYTWLISLCTFSAFSVVSAMKGLSGEGSCGCFGAFTVNPWYTMTFDAAVVIFLSIVHPRLNFEFKYSTPDRRKLKIIFVVWLMLAIPSLFVMLSVKQSHVAIGTETIDPYGNKMISIEPETWIDKELPLIDRLAQPENGKTLQNGTWTVILVQADCQKCHKLLAELEETDISTTVLIEIPVPSNHVLPKTAIPVFKLDGGNGWFAITPCIIMVSNGICTEVNENP